MPSALSSKTAAVIRHVHFEDLGVFEPVLAAAGYAVRYCDVDAGGLAALEPLSPQLLVVLGGPVGVGDAGAYPFLEIERRILEARLEAGRPTLGVCLGAQLMAAALGAEVAPMGRREIGFGPLTLEPAGRAGPLAHLHAVPVLHWHSDALQTPAGGAALATTPLCATQGFSRGPNVLGLQFHAEVDAGPGFERWLVGHAVELALAGVDVARLREEGARIAPALREASGRMLSAWLAGLRP